MFTLGNQPGHFLIKGQLHRGLKIVMIMKVKMGRSIFFQMTVVNSKNYHGIFGHMQTSGLE